MLSPAEALGLSGAALDARVRRAVNHIPDRTLARLSRRLADDARVNGVVYERAGKLEPVRIMLRPLLVMPEQVAYLHQVCNRIMDALKRLPQLYFEDPEVRATLPLAADEEGWLRECRPALEGGSNPIYGRLDAVCDFTGARWQDSLQFMEPNLSGVGGIQLGPLANSLVMRDIVPTVVAHDPGLTIDEPRDQRDLFLQVMLDHARSAGRSGSTLCLVEPKYAGEGPAEQSALARWCRDRHGITVVHADPRELRLVDDEIWYQDTCVDVAYRDYEMRDLLELERDQGTPLEAMRALFRQNRIVSSAGGEFDHKSCWELLTDDRLARRHFSNHERLLFSRHILWTRRVCNRTTTLPLGRGDLPEYIRRHRESLVLKPNRACGGEGVHIGALQSQSEWDVRVDEALGLQDDPHRSWVVQSVANLPVHEFPVVDDTDGRVHHEPFYAVLGFTPTDHGLAILCRVSQKQVVNVAQQGGLAPVLIGYRPEDLRAPMRAALNREVAERRLVDRIRQLRDLDAVTSLLDWDEETFLPDEGRERRGQQLATIETLHHELLVDDELGDLIEEVAGSGGGSVSAEELAELRRSRRIACALPHDLVGAFAEARSRALAAWEAARVQDDFGIFAGPFEKLIRLVRERAQALQRGGDLYDGLLDEFEPGLTRARLDPLLRQVGLRLVDLVPGYAERTAASSLPLAGPFSGDAQEAFCRRLLGDMGFAFQRGRMDRSTHPFTMMAGEHDVRLTLRYFEDSPLPAVFGALHEGGHALYDQGFPGALHGTLLAEAPGMGIHESQSRLWENHVGRSQAFWSHYFPILRDAFPDALGALDAERFHRGVNVVTPSLVRVDADAATYDLHILLRYELEIALLSGDLPVSELPGAWRDASLRWLGIAPAGVRNGCLQDVHWALGSIGYFPTYTLGNLYAAELVESYGRQGDLDAELARGDLSSLRHWLADEVYHWGCRLDSETIISRATGRAPDADAYFRTLAKRFA